MVSVLAPDRKPPLRLKVPILNVGLEAGPPNRSGPLSWVKPSVGDWIWNELTKLVPKLMLALPAVPPNVPKILLKKI